MKKVAQYIKDNDIEYAWRGNAFVIWPLYYEIKDFLEETNILMHMEYEMIDGCAISDNSIAITLTDIFWTERVEKYFSKEN